MPALAALCLILAVLIGERALARPRRLTAATSGAHGLVQLQVGALLIGAMTAAAVTLILAHGWAVIAALAGWLAGGVALLWLAQRRPAHRPVRIGVLLAILTLLHLGVALLAADVRGWLAWGLGFALGFALGLPAFLALAQRMDDRELPDCMRPLPARLLLAGVLALALGSLVSW